MCTNPITIKMKPSAMDVYRGVTSVREVTIPCGKCAECLSKRQNDLSTRVYYEAKVKGSATFITLTYAPEHEPFSQSLWCSDLNTGECFRLTDAEPVVNLDRLDVLRQEFLGIKGCVREYNVDICDFEDYHYFVRYTPTLYYRDVQLALKRFRKNNPDLPNFTYVFVGEYGQNPHGTFRPHYHCILFGLNYNQAVRLCDEWSYGFTTCKQVSFINSDKSDGLARVSRYVGKYCAKGKFDYCSKRDGLTLSSRLCSSKGLGLEAIFHLKDWFLAKDVFDYNPDDISGIPESKLNEICERIVMRSFVSVGDYKYGLPQSFRRFVFGYRIIKDRSSYPSMFKEKVYGFRKKAVYYPIFYAVSDFVRDRVLQTDACELAEFGVYKDSKNLREAVAAFNAYKQDVFKNREKIKEASILQFYQLNSQI